MNHDSSLSKIDELLAFVRNKIKIRVLALDDDVTYLRFLERISTKIDWVKCDSLESFIKGVKNNNLDCLLVDINLGSECGISVIENLKNLISCPVCFISGVTPCDKDLGRIRDLNASFIPKDLPNGAWHSFLSTMIR